MSEAAPPVPNSDIQIRFDSVCAAMLSVWRPLVSASGPYICVLICPRQAVCGSVRPSRALVKLGLEPSGTLTLVPGVEGVEPDAPLMERQEHLRQVVGVGAVVCGGKVVVGVDRVRIALRATAHRQPPGRRVGESL